MLSRGSMILITVTVLLLAVSSAMDWSQYKRDFDKHYPDPVQDLFRRRLFSRRCTEIEEHNRRHQQGLEDERWSVTVFADMTEAELTAYLSLEVPELDDVYEEAAIYEMDAGYSTPREINWAKQGALNEVQNQGRCLSCYAFAVTAALEAQYFIETGRLVKLSEQQIVDCSRPFNNSGCRAGRLSATMEYIRTNGIQEGSEYPYVGRAHQCRATNASDSVLRLIAFQRLNRGDEVAMEQALAMFGPLVAAIDATSIKYFGGGTVLKADSRCTRLNHAVTVVGYGTADNVPYWLVRNSWGRHWGEDGYFRVERHKNYCGIADMAMYPVVDPDT